MPPRTVFPPFSGRFVDRDDLMNMSNAQMRAAFVIDELAEPDGRIPYTRSQIARIAGVAAPRVSEAVAYLINRGKLAARVVGSQEAGYRFVAADEPEEESSAINDLERGLEQGIAWLDGDTIRWREGYGPRDLA